MEYTYVTKAKKNFNVAINCKINLQGNLAIIYVLYVIYISTKS